MDGIKVMRAALDELPNGEIILRGVIAPESMRLLKADKYQREILSPSKINKLMNALRTSTVPDVELSLRGEDFDETGPDAYELHGDVYIVDGLQRITATMRLLTLEPHLDVHLGAKIYFGKNYDWERARFNVLNLTQTKVNSNVILRNLADDNPTIKSLLALCNRRDFVMKDRVAWQQQQHRNHLITATTMLKVVGMLHSHAGPGRGSSAVDLAAGVHKTACNIGPNKFTGNVRRFFEVIDESWGVRQVAYKEGAVHMRLSFLVALARMFSEHVNFWENDRLEVDTATIRKLQTFAMNDPTVISMASGSGKADEVLFSMLVRHINYNRRKNLLVPRTYYASSNEEPEGGDE